MLKRLIEWSVQNPLVVGVLTLCLAIGGVYALRQTPLDALQRPLRRAGDRAGGLQ